MKKFGDRSSWLRAAGIEPPPESVSVLEQIDADLMMARALPRLIMLTSYATVTREERNELPIDVIWAHMKNPWLIHHLSPNLQARTIGWYHGVPLVLKYTPIEQLALENFGL